MTANLAWAVKEKALEKEKIKCEFPKQPKFVHKLTNLNRKELPETKKPSKPLKSTNTRLPLICVLEISRIK